MNRTTSIWKWVLFSVTLLLCLAAAEIALRIVDASRQKTLAEAAGVKDALPPRAVFMTAPPPFYTPELPLHILKDTPVLYGLNPKHPEINTLGMRDDETIVQKPKGRLRVLVLGDSVAFGPGTPRNETFPNRLEALLKSRFPDAEVLNAAVAGYTAYNELQYYLTEGRRLKADVVLLQFCMNDVVNPRIHWGYTAKEIDYIPDEAIPNLAYDRTWVPFKMKELGYRRQKAAREKPGFFYRHSALVRFVRDRSRGWFEAQTPDALVAENLATRPSPPKPRVSLPPNTPVFLTGEDRIGLDVLLDDNSPEMNWLRHIYTQLDEAVKEDGATLVIAVFPMAYQVDPTYPLKPQQNLLAFCKQRNIRCIDMLDAFRSHAKEDIFMLKESNFHDWWHLSNFGHTVSAEALFDYFQEELLPDLQRENRTFDGS